MLDSPRHRRRRARAQGVARGAVPHGLPRAQRRRVAEAHRHLSATAAGTHRSPTPPVTITQWGPEERTTRAPWLSTPRIRRYSPRRARRAVLGGARRSTSTGTARCSTASCRPRTAWTARSASAARAARRSADPAACASTAARASRATPTSTRRCKGPRDGVIEVEPMGNMPVIKDLIVDMDAVHWKKIQRVTPWLINKQPVAGARVHRPARGDGRRHAVDGLHPVRRLRVGLPVDGGRTAVHRPGRAGQGLPLRRRPARRPAGGAPAATSPRIRTGSTTARTASSASRRAPRASRR